MNYLRLLFLFLIATQSVLSAQSDSTKKSFKPYGLIDAAPVAINKNDFKPQINITIQSIEVTTNKPVDAKIAYFTFSDSIKLEKKGKEVSIATIGNEKITIISNAHGYMWQTQEFNTPVFDTSYVLKFSKIKKGDKITLHYEPLFYKNLLIFQEFLKINPGVKIQISCDPDSAEKVFLNQVQNIDKKRIRINSLQNKKQKYSGTFIIKILHT